MRSQADDNYAWFKSQRAQLVDTHCGQHALIHNQSLCGFFQTSLDAVKAGLTTYGEDNFSVEPVSNIIEDLGFHSHVGSALHA